MSKLLKSKFLLGVVIVAVMFVGVVAVSNTAAAACSTGTTTLRVGSTGSTVACLQAAVGAVADGSFGQMTKAKVMAWQSANGLVADGVFGAKSRAVLEVGAVVSGNYPAGCTSASGFSSTTGASCASGVSTGPCTGGALFNSATGAACTADLPAGCSSTAGYSPTTGVACSATPAVSSTGEGSITVTYDATPANSLVVNKGETKAVMAWKVKATGSDMKVSRLWLDLDKRIWLSASDMTLKDGDTVVGTVALSASTVVETTVGSAWQVQFNGLNIVVPVGTTKILTLTVTRPVLTSASDSVAMANTSSFRATDASGLSLAYTVTARTIALTGSTTATTGTLTATLSPTSPLAQSVSGLSTTAGILTAVKLTDIDLKAVDGAVNVSALSGTITNAGTCTNDGTSSQCIASTELRDGTTVLASVTGANVWAFTGLNIDVAAGTTKTLSIWAKVNPISATLVAGDNIKATLTAGTATTNGFASSVTFTPTVAGNIQYLYQYAPTIALGTTTATTTNTSGAISADYSLAFTVTAPAGSAIYVHKTVDVATATNNNAEKTTSGSGGTLADATPMTASATSGTDGSTYFIVLAGTSRTFTVYSHLPVGGSAGYTGVKLSRVYWAMDDSATGAQAQTWGLQNFNTASVYVTAS